jgi:predicted transcriptional regulator
MSKTENGVPLEINPLSQVRRSPMEMVCDILGVLSQGPTKPTHILYKANMSWKVLSTYLDYLMTKGIIEKDGDEGKRTVYRLTEKGKSILAMYDDLRHSLAGDDPNGRGSAAMDVRQQSAWPWL